jgi:hypothetical protein
MQIDEGPFTEKEGDTIPKVLKDLFFVEKEKPNLLDYDAVGFNDQAFVKYNYVEFAKHTI